jgi:outer membrane immunogenic protein
LAFWHSYPSLQSHRRTDQKSAFKARDFSRRTRQATAQSNVPTRRGGFLIGYRYNFNRWLGAEANYGYDRNRQFYFGGTPAGVQSDIHQLTGAAAVKLPTFLRLQPYALAGAGALVFDPAGNFGGSFEGPTTETRDTFVYGVGAQYALTRHPSLRAEYRGLVYKAPDFNLAGLNTDSWTQIA